MEYHKAIDFAINKLQSELDDDLKYHSIEHTLGVLRSCEFLAKKSEVSKNELPLLLTAAAYHDIGFTEAYSNHEEIGCKIVGDKLPEYGYTEEEISKIQSMIMATKIPQSPTTLLEKVLCDADLDYLGGDKYGEISDRLYEELGFYKKQLNEEEWLNMQINFMEHHNYWTDFAKKVLSPKKEIVLKKLKLKKPA